MFGLATLLFFSLTGITLNHPRLFFDGVATSVEAEGRVVFRYAAGPVADGYGNPNGSLRDIAGISNAAGNVVGLMPHPEHAVEPLIGTGRSDGLGFFTSVLKKLVDA